MNQKSKTSLLVSSIFGGVILFGSALFFSGLLSANSTAKLPFYAWAIFGIIAIIYALHQRKVLKGYDELSFEVQSLSDASQGIEIAPNCEVSKRHAFVQKLASQGKAVSPSVFREILGARQASKQVGNGSYAVVLLGLLGTFIGLAEVVSQAGVISGNAAQSIEVIIPQIFSNMQGIFGTTLCGLAASFFLRKNEETLEQAYLEFYADLEEYTQFELLPSLDQGGDSPITDSLNKLTQTLNGFPSLVQSSLHEPLREILSEAHQKMLSASERQEAQLLQGIEKSVTASAASFSQSHEALLQQFSSRLTEEFNHVNESRTQTFEDIQNKQAKTFDDIQSKQSDYFEKLESKMSGLGGNLNAAQEKQNELIQSLSDGIQLQLSKSDENEASRQEKMTQNLAQLETKHQEFLTQFKTRGEEWMNSLQGFSEDLSAGITKLNQEGLEKISTDFKLLAETAKEGLESTSKLSADVQEKLTTMMTGLSQITEGVAQSSEYMKVNQVEMQATIEMFNQGVEMLVDHLGKDGEEDSEQVDFYQKLETTLEMFHEKASESLVENSIRTQEILLQILQQSQSSQGK